jgi:outer membrane protein assembly factor BamB
MNRREPNRQSSPNACRHSRPAERSARWSCLACLLAGIAAAGCDRRSREGGASVEGAAAEPAARAAWHTHAWPMTRGGPGLQGRVPDPVPRQPVVAWSLPAGAELLAEPALDRDLAVFGDAEGTVHAVNLTTKQVLWTFPAGDAVAATPAIAGGRVFVGTDGGNFHALDLGTGKPLWQLESDDKFPTGAVVPPAADGDDGRVLVNGYDGMARCLRAADGGVVWSYQTESYLNGSPAVLDGQSVSFGGCDNVLHTIRLADGKEPSKLELDAQVITSVATFGNMVYAVNYANQLVAAPARGTKPEWVHEAPDDAFASAPGVDEQRVYVGSRDQHLHAIDRLSGKPAWKFKTGGDVASAPLVFDDAVVFGSADGRLYAVAKDDGKELWRVELGEELQAAAAFADGRLVVAGADGTLFVITGK